MTHDPLAPFHPVIRRWFRDQVGNPTEVQALAWPRIAAGDHVLASAPTGSGKTLAAFLWALDRLLGGEWATGATRVLYISPLRALNNDIRRNLLQPLAALSDALAIAGEPVPDIGVMTRSGDTTPTERQRMLRHPPEILITTPESLNILLTSRRGRDALSGLTTVIIDEVHAVAGSKRGVHLITAVERLVPLCGEFQRIALSATVEPPERIAAWVGGSELIRRGGHASYQPRVVSTVVGRTPKQYDLKVRMAGPTANDRGDFETIWPFLGDALKQTVRSNRSTLIFTNSKRKVESVARILNDGEPEELVWSHHGALSRELRAVVEKRLKQGELAGIVATNSLELGIDIGDLDEVALVQTPPSVASTVQRVGRAGHAVGQVSRGRLYPLYPRDVLDAAVVARSMTAGEVEPLTPIRGALDVLAQVLLSMCAAEEWQVDALFDAVRCAAPYRDLPRQHFDLVLEMLAGRYATTRVRELRPLVSLDRVRGTVRARRGSDRLIYLSGGTIPDRGYFHLRRSDSSAKIGELDEEFVWERSIGDTFTLGVQSWRVERITHNDVFVTPASSGASMAPFWRAEARDSGGFLADRVAAFLEDADGRLDDPAFRDELQTDCCMEPAAAEALLLLLQAQKRASGGTLPHRHHLVIERVTGPHERNETEQVVLHTLWGGRVNRPFALALQDVYLEWTGRKLEVMHDDDCLTLRLPAGVRARDLLDRVKAAEVDDRLRARLESTGFFGGRFREAAGRAMLLPRRGFRHRTPLWMTRQRAKRLMEAIRGLEDFPILLEAWRTSLQDATEPDRLRARLEELQQGEITVRQVTTDAPSPFAANVQWKQTNELMYADDAPEGGGPSGLRPDLLREVMFDPQLRPALPPGLVDRFVRKLQRVFPGYAPGTARDLLDWVVERVLIPDDEWLALRAAIERDHDVDIDEMLAELSDRLTWLQLGQPALCAVENLPRLQDLRDGTASAELVGELLRFQGPITDAWLTGLLGVGDLSSQLDALQQSELVLVDRLTQGVDAPQICDAENLERMLRIARAAARPSLEPRPVVELPLFQATHAGLGSRRTGVEGLSAALEPLMGSPAAAGLWESEILPARVDGYDSSWLDTLLAESDLTWVGCGQQRLTFSFTGDLDLLAPSGEAPGGDAPPDDSFFPDGPGRFGLTELAQRSDLGTADLTQRLWQLAWAGQVTNDGFAAVRQGIATRFEPQQQQPPARQGRRAPRRRFGGWQATRAFAGSWLRLPAPPPPEDAIDAEELRRERVRLLLDRHGVLFRELLQRELPGLRWGPLFRALRLMELSGEVVTGQFFEGVQGVQFASHAAVRALMRGLDRDRVWWLTAADPASPCGLGLDLDLPRRVPSNHLAFHGPDLVVLSERRGKSLDIRVPHDHPRLLDYLAFLDTQLTRTAAPVRSIVVETINGDPAADSPYRPPLAGRFHVTGDRGTLHLGKRF